MSSFLLTRPSYRLQCKQLDDGLLECIEVKPSAESMHPLPPPRPTEEGSYAGLMLSAAVAVAALAIAASNLRRIKTR